MPRTVTPVDAGENPVKRPTKEIIMEKIKSNAQMCYEIYKDSLRRGEPYVGWEDIFPEERKAWIEMAYQLECHIIKDMEEDGWRPGDPF